jgi:hypothetical protein
LSRTRQRFEGSSIETALAAAVASLGPDLEVSEARKVRSRGMLGFFAKEHYEVLAEPKLSGDVLARAEASIDDTLQNLMAQIEAEETGELNLPTPRQPDAAFAVSLAAATTDLPPPETPAQPVQPAPPPATRHESLGPAETPAPLSRPGEPLWSRAALLHLGIDGRFLARVMVADGADDQAWTFALADAVKTELIAAEAAVPDGSITITGTGAAAAITLINAAACGLPVERLRLPGGDVPATALELAMAVRSCLPR